LNSIIEQTYSNYKSVINIFIERALNNLDINVYGYGKREQNFIYIKDVIQAIEICLNKISKISGIYSIVSEENTSMLELAHIIKRICNSTSKIVVGEVVDLQEKFRPSYDYSRAMKELGYKPNYNIYKGLTEYIEWYVRNK